MPKNHDTLQELKSYAKQLRLAYIHKNIKELIEEADVKEQGIAGFLCNILSRECDQRMENGKIDRIRLANFPYKKYLEDLRIESLPEDARRKLKQLETLDFIKSGQNVILAGNPGTGKTHIAIGLGIKACMNGYKVLFTTIPQLINKLKEHRATRTLLQLERQFERYDLIIADELGYISFDKEGGELLFSLLSLRAERKSTIITTNLSFERWEEIFKDPIMTAAMVDRLTHKSYIVSMNGNSYRLKETEDWLKNQ